MKEVIDPGERAPKMRRGRIAGTLAVSWLITVAFIWTGFALAPAGALATADAGTLVSIRGSTVITTRGYFQVVGAPSAALGTSMKVVRTNSVWSGTGLQLCTLRNLGYDSWCSDLCDGFAGKFLETPLAARAQSHGTMTAFLWLAAFLTMFGWIPAVVVLGSSD